MGHSKPGRLETAPTGVIALMVGAVSNCAVSNHAPMRCGWKPHLPGWNELTSRLPLSLAAAEVPDNCHALSAR